MHFLLALTLCAPRHGHHHHHRHHHPKPVTEIHQVDTVQVGTAIQVERHTLHNGTVITVTHRPGVQVP